VITDSALASRAAIRVLGRCLEIAAQHRGAQQVSQKPGCGRLYRDALSCRQTPKTAIRKGAYLRKGTRSRIRCCFRDRQLLKETSMTFGKGILLWLIGIPIPIIILLALFWR
jgi:hypothetical protein